MTVGHAAYCWGFNGYGRLGDGTTDPRLVPTLVAGGVSFDVVTAGNAHTCGISTDHVAYCWGWNERGQLGDGTTGQRLIPTAIVQ